MNAMARLTNLTPVELLLLGGIIFAGARGLYCILPTLSPGLVPFRPIRAASQ